MGTRSTGFVTHCGWVDFEVFVDYTAECCDHNALPNGPLVTYQCVQTNPTGCNNNSFSTKITNGGPATGATSSKKTPAVRSYPPVAVSRSAVGGLDFTISSYGSILPIVFGSDKLTGNVFWASPVVEHIFTVDGELKTYNTLNFALGLCEGEISGVLRMWVGDLLILDNTANIDVNGIMQPNDDGFVMGFTIDLTDPDSPLQNLDAADRQTKVTVFNGGETQLPEGAIVAAEGYDNTPAYRGVAYVLFENWVTTDSSLPAIYVEVAAHVTNLWPRLYADLVGTTFDQFDHTLLCYDPFFDRIYSSASHTGGGGVEGLVVFDGNSLEEIAQQAYSDSNQWENTLITMGGFLVNTASDGNQGIVRTLNPFTGTVVDSIGPGGGITGHSLTTGFGVMQSHSITLSAFDENGLLVDVFVGISLLNDSIGLASISPSGQIKMEAVLNSTLPAENSFCQAVIIDDDLALVHPTFADAAPTAGIHIYGMSYDDGETNQFTPWRLTLSGNGATLAAPVYAAQTPISFTEFGGTGFTHTIGPILVDIDGGLVFFVVPETLAGRSTRIVKYNPYTGTLDWNTPTTGMLISVASNDGGSWGMLTGTTYAWVDTNGVIRQVDLKTGDVTVLLSSLGDQSLPTNVHRHQYYNGYENSILYFSGIAGQHVVKVYLDRLTRSTALVSTIVEELSARAGLKASDLTSDDIAVLSVDGYTIKSKKSIRNAISELQQAFLFDVVETSGKIKYRTRGGSADFTISHKYLRGEDNAEWLPVTQTNDGARNRKINLTYRDLNRDYDDNVQSVILDKSGSQVIDSQAAIDVSVPIVLTADKAKKLAEILLFSKEVYKTQYEFTLPPRYQSVDPADVLAITMPDATTTTMRVRKASIGADRSVACTASREDPDIYNDTVNLFGNVGRFNSSQFPTRIPRIDVIGLPIGGRADSDFSATTSNYRLYLTFLPYRASDALTSPFTLNLINADGVTPYLLDPPVSYPTWGFVVNPPNYTPSAFSYDEESQLRVALVNVSDVAMASAVNGLDDLLASSQCNLCLVGGELIQFANATDEGNGVWLLTGLVRGKFATEGEIGTATSGSKFVLLAGADAILDTNSVLVVNLPLTDGPEKAYQAFIETNNPFQPSVAQVTLLRNLQPWPIADLAMVYNGDDAEITWQRRTRFGGEWPDDGSDAVPLNESEERYIVWIFSDPTTFSPVSASRYLRREEVTSPAFTYTLAMQTADGFDNTADDLYAMVAQTGSLTGQDVGYGTVMHLPHI